MAANQYDFKIEQGSSHKLSFIYKDSDKNPIDISGYCARLTWKTNTNISQIFTTENLDYSTYKFVIDTPTSDGKMTLYFPASTTNGFDFSTAKYDLELQSTTDLYTGGGKETLRILYGNVTIAKRYSKSTELLDCT
jgi:hypothetical protein